MCNRFADRLLDAAQLPKMVADVDDVEATPLVRAHRAEEEVGGHPLRAKALSAAVDESVHPIDLLT